MEPNQADPPDDVTNFFNRKDPAPKDDPAFEKQKQPPHHDTVRAWVAWSILAMLGVVTVWGLVVWTFTDKDIREYTILVTPISTIAGVIIGFYFAQNSDR